MSSNRNNSSPDYWIYGLHAVYAALENPIRRITRVIASDEEIQAKITANSFPCTLATKAEFQKVLGPQAVHQGLAALVKPLPALTLDDVIDRAADKCVLAFLDQVTDPHNVGAILRSAAAFGIDAVVVTAQNSPQNYGVLAKSASGGFERTPLVTVTNLSRSLEFLKGQGFWCIGLDGLGNQELHKLSPFDKMALVLGAEGKGLRKLTREHCDLLVKIPTDEAFGSLNVSNAAAVAFYGLTIQKNLK